MSFLRLILSNLLRQKTRTFLTVLGISIGITAVVALGVITESVKQASAEILTVGGSDFAVGRAGSADLTFSVLTDGDLETLQSYEEIEHTTGVLMAFARVGSNPFFVQAGVDPAALEHFDLPVLDGRRLAPDAPRETMLGKSAAEQLNAKVGDTVEIRDETFDVVGIFESGAIMLDGGAVMPLATIQEIERKEGLVTLAFVQVHDDVDVQALADRIEDENPELATLVTLDDYSDVDQGLEIIDAVNLGVTVLAVFIGGIAVMNTMVMAVFERTREFGILRALGWRTRRILQMVLGESLMLCALAAIFGSIIAVAITRLVVLLPAIQSFLSPVYTPEVFLRGLAVGVGVALLGALYPAYRAATYSPAQAIRYE
jgi:putative ABC transport system permease protein